MVNTVDVMIIGGGPAGTSAGTVLRRKGYKTCIIDTQVFPRKKLCAGVLTIKSLRLFQHIYKGINFDDLEIRHIHKIMFMYMDKIIGKYTVKNAYSVIDRSEFDNMLLQYYKGIGGLAVEGEKGYEILYNKNTVRLSDGNEIRYRILIGADGINSKVRPYVNHSWRASILCFEEFIPNTLNENIIRINFGGVLGGYSWRIPGKKHVGIGLGEFYIRGMRRKPEKYRRYFASQGVEDLTNIRGAFVSFGNYVHKPIKRNVLLVGDAAGLVDAMTGEGLFFAAESGRQAALSIAEYIEKGIPLINYMNRIKKIHKKMNEQSIYNKLLYVPGFRLISIRHLRKNPDFVHNILDNAISSYSAGYTKEIWKNKWKRKH